MTTTQQASAHHTHSGRLLLVRGDLAEETGRWRREQGLTLQQAARLLRVAHTTVRNWEAGRRPHPEHAARLGELLGPATPKSQITPLRAHRLRLSMSLTGLARRLHVSPGVVSRWETAVRAPAPHHRTALAQVLGLPAAEVEALFIGYPETRLRGVRLPSLGVVRQQAGRRQRELAHALGIGLTTASGWENGRAPVPRDAVLRLAEFLGLSGDELVRRATPGRRPPEGPPGLQQLRHRAGMTQAEAAVLVSVSTPTLARYERGERTTPVPVARALARAYRVPWPAVARAAGLGLVALPPAASWGQLDQAELLPLLRRHAGLSGARLARRVGVSPQTVARWENGRTAVPDRWVPGLSRALGAPVSPLRAAVVRRSQPAARSSVG